MFTDGHDSCKSTASQSFEEVGRGGGGGGSIDHNHPVPRPPTCLDRHDRCVGREVAGTVTYDL